jgi:PAS domain S-box-containing protein
VSIRSIVAVWTLALLAAAGAITAVLTSDHVTGEAPTIALAVPTGLAFIASGLVARARRPANGTGVLLILVGFAWYLAALPSAEQPLLFTVGMALNGLFIGFLAHLLLAFPSGRLSSRVERVIAAAMYFVVTVLPFFVLLFDEGEVSTSFCERGTCPDNLLATIPAQDAALALAAVYGIAAGLLAIGVAVVLVQRWRRASPALRAALNPIVLTAGILIATFAVQIVASAFSERVARAVNWALLGAMLALPLAFLYGLLRPRLTASSRRLAAELSEQRTPEGVQEVLRRVLRDPTLEVGYLTTTKHGYVGVDGETLRLPATGSGRTVTDVGEEIIVHDSALLDQPELDEAVDAARIALERGLSLRSLEATAQRETALLDAIPDNVYRTAADGTLLEAHVKDTGAEGKFASGMIGRKIGDALPPEITDVVMDGIRRALASGEPATIEYSVETPDGVQHLEERIVRSGSDEAVGIVRDVTERKRQERALQELADEQAALSRVAVAVATERNPQRVFDVVTEEVGRLFRAQGANLARYEADPSSALIVGSWEAEPGLNVHEGHRVALDGPTPVALVRRTGRPARVDSFDGMEGTTAERIRELGVRSGAAAPVHVAGQPWGAVVVSSGEPGAFDIEAEERLAKFASLVGVAIANAQAHEQLTASRARIVRAGDEERSRLERNLHDGAQQRLVALSLALRLVQSRLDDDPAAAGKLLEAAAEELTVALEELRELARGIHPAILSNRGLHDALEALAARAPVPVELNTVCRERLPPSVEAAAYYVIAESLTNVAKYAQASAAQVSVTRRDGIAVVVVEDDGVGGADASRGSGLRGLADRVEALEGRLRIESAPGRGTRVEAEIPIDSSSN